MKNLRLQKCPVSLFRVGLLCVFSVVTALPVVSQTPGDWGALYGSLRYHMALDLGNDPTLQLESNSTRFGLDINRNIWPWLSAVGRIEFAMDYGDGGRSLDASGSTHNILDQTPIGLRLGYAGLDFKKYGNLLVGKIWSVYYDVSQYTDRFRVGGVTASGTFTMGLDGGITGTGRAETTLAYRVKMGGWSLGAQAQFRPDGYWVSGGATSIQYEFPIGLTAGIAVNCSRPSEDILADWISAGGRSYALTSIGGIRFRSDSWYLAALASYQLGNEIIYDIGGLPTQDLVYDAFGVEFVANYHILTWMRLNYGFNLLLPTSDISPADPDYRVYAHYFGVDFLLTKNIIIYLQYTLDLGIDDVGASQPDAMFLGLRFDFNLGF
jgi:predicted porin